MNFTFDPETHIYKLDDREIPSVTQIIKEVFGEREWWSVHSAEVGRALHLAVHYYNTGSLDKSSLDDQIIGRFAGFEKFKIEAPYIIKQSEVVLFSSKYRFAGTLDMVMENNIIADVKSSLDRAVYLQLGGYSILLNHAKKAFAVVLSKKGTYKLSDIIKGTKIKYWENAFLNCLSVYNLMKRHKI